MGFIFLDQQQRLPHFEKMLLLVLLTPHKKDENFFLLSNISRSILAANGMAARPRRLEIWPRRLIVFVVVQMRLLWLLLELR